MITVAPKKKNNKKKKANKAKPTADLDKETVQGDDDLSDDPDTPGLVWHAKLVP